MRNGLWAAGILYALLSIPASSQVDSAEALTARAMRAHQAKDYSTFLLLEKQLLTLTPNDPGTLYNVACGEALLNHPAAALASLEKVLKLHIDLHAARDPDLAGIVKTPEWGLYEEHLAAMLKPVVVSTVAFTLAEKGLVATSVAIDERYGDSYIGSLRERKILKRTKDGTVSDFATQKDGLLGVSSLLLDPIRNQLFAAMTAVPFMRNFQKEDEGKAGVLVFDLTTGKLLRSALSDPGVHHVLAEMAEDSRGNIFILDTASSEIRRLRRSSTELELFMSSVVFRAPRGIALSADERTLYVTDLATGIWAVDVLSIDRVPIDAPADIWLGGVVGLARAPGGFVSLQTGVQPNRVIKIRVDFKSNRLTSLETLESNHPLYEGPMPGTIVGGDLVYVADSELDLIDPKTGAFPADRAKETVVLRLPLGN